MADKVISDLASQSSVGAVPRRWAEVQTGEFAPEVQALRVASKVRTLWSSNTLLAISSEAVSGWVDVSRLDQLMIMKSSTGGTYSFEVDWSRDGVTVDIVEIVAVTEDTSVVKSVASLFVRLRVRNTSGAAAFTEHLTVVNAR